MILLERGILDFVKTFGRPGILLSVEPKMANKNKEDRNSEQVQASDEEGTPKWVATIACPVKAYGREKYINLPVTVASKTQPLAGVLPGQTVVPENLEMGIMKMEKGGSTQFFSASSIRAVTMPAQATQSPAPVPQR